MDPVNGGTAPAEPVAGGAGSAPPHSPPHRPDPWRQAWRDAWRLGLLGAQVRWWLGQQLRTAWRRMGWAGLSLGLLALACATALAASLWQRQALQALERQPLADFVAPRRAQPLPASPTAEDRERMQAFVAGLPSHRNIPQAVQDLLKLADQHGVLMAKGDYQFQPDAAAGFARYRMVLPVQGAGTAVRRFVAAALHAQPSLGIESLQLRREQAQQAQIEARIEWVLYTRLPEAEAHP